MATLGLIVLAPPLERGIFNLLKRRLKTDQVGLTMALLSELRSLLPWPPRSSPTHS
jgi:hypothetical protein